MLEIGAGPGRKNNTAWLIHERNWRGMLVEARPGRFARLAQRNRNRSGVLAVQELVRSANVDDL
jgi:hypothetical protein